MKTELEKNPSRKKSTAKRYEEALGMPRIEAMAKAEVFGKGDNGYFKLRKDYYQYLREMQILRLKVKDFFYNRKIYTQRGVEFTKITFKGTFFRELIDAILLSEKAEILNIEESEGMSIQTINNFRSQIKYALGSPNHFTIESYFYVKSYQNGFITFLTFADLDKYEALDLSTMVPDGKTYSELKYNFPENVLSVLRKWQNNFLKKFPIFNEWRNNDELKKIFLDPSIQFDMREMLNTFEDTDLFSHYDSMIKVSPLIKKYVITTDMPPVFHLENLAQLENTDVLLKGKKIHDENIKFLDAELRRSSPRKYLVTEYQAVINSYQKIMNKDRDGLFNIKDKELLSEMKIFIGEYSSGLKIDQLYWGVTIIQYENDYFWESLGEASCDLEANAMNHCGNSPRRHTQDLMYSFRKKLKDNTYKVLMTVTINNGFVMEWKAYGNSMPSERFHPFIVDLLLNDIADIKNATGEIGFAYEDNFKFSHLSDEFKAIVLKKKPNIDKVGHYIVSSENWDDTYLVRAGFKLNKNKKYELVDNEKDMFAFLVHDVFEKDERFSRFLKSLNVSNDYQTKIETDKHIEMIISNIVVSSMGVFSLSRNADQLTLTYDPVKYINAFYYKTDKDSNDFKYYDPEDGIILKIAHFRI